MWAREPPGSGGTEPEEQPPSRERGVPLDASMQRQAERAFGVPLGDVRVHAGGDGARRAESVGARATAHGRELSFAAGEYAPGTLFGDALIAHELAHVAQQRGGAAVAGAPGERHERDADRAAMGVLGVAEAAGPPRERAGPSLQRCTRGKSSDAGLSGDAGIAADGGADGGTTANPSPVAGVRSLELPKWMALYGGGALGKLRHAWKRRDKVIRQRVALEPPRAESERLEALEARWKPMSGLLGDEHFDPFSASLDEAVVRELVAADRADAKALPDGQNKWVKGEVELFAKAVIELLDTRQKAAEEPAEFHRFDDLFTDPDVITLLAGAEEPFTPAELKAIVGKESGDFTNTAAAGIEGKSKGITSRVVNKKGAVGVAQLKDDALGEALKWAGDHRVDIPASPDPRLVPATAIKLAAAYFGQLEHLLRFTWPRYSADPQQRKKLVLAAYNWGPGNVNELVKKLGARREENGVTYSMVERHLPEETKEYVVLIKARLGP